MIAICKNGVDVSRACGCWATQESGFHNHQRRKYGSSTVLRMPNRRRNRRYAAGTVSSLPRDCGGGWLTLQPQIRGRILVSLVPFAWGSWTPVARGVASFPAPPPPLTFLVGMQAVGFATLFAAMSRGEESEKIKKLFSSSGGHRAILKGCELGFYLFSASALQLAAVQQSSATRVSFLVQLATVFVPFVEAAVYRKPVAKSAITLSMLALIGVTIMAFDDPAQIASGLNQDGDFLSVGAALVYAINVVRLGKAAEVTDPLSLAFSKAGSQFFFSIATVIAIGGFADGNDWASLQSPETLVIVAMAMLWNGAVVSAGATYAMAEGQKSSRMAPSQAQIIYSLQPIIAAVIECIFLGERLSSHSIFGGFLIVAASWLGNTSWASTLDGKTQTKNS